MYARSFGSPARCHRTSIAEIVAGCLARFARGTATLAHTGSSSVPEPIPIGQRPFMPQHSRRTTAVRSIGYWALAPLASIVAFARLLRVGSVDRRIRGWLLAPPHGLLVGNPKMSSGQVGPSQIPKQFVEHVALRYRVDPTEAWRQRESSV